MFGKVCFSTSEFQILLKSQTRKPVRCLAPFNLERKRESGYIASATDFRWQRPTGPRASEVFDSVVTCRLDYGSKHSKHAIRLMKLSQIVLRM